MDLELYVDPIFAWDIYLKTYKYNMSPLDGSSMWSGTTYTPTPITSKIKKSA